MDKLPPISKIYEAYSAIADNPVTLEEDSAHVTSSNGAKQYLVTWKGELYTSNDNASYWAGYAGYPILAVLMLQGKLPLNREYACLFQGINWTDLNEKYKRKYDEAVAEILKRLQAEGIDCNPIQKEVSCVMEKLRDLPIQTKRSAKRPPKSNKVEL